MTNEKTAIINDEAASRANSSCSNAKSFISRERSFQDALEDDEVREVLRGFHQLSKGSPAKKT